MKLLQSRSTSDPSLQQSIIQRYPLISYFVCAYVFAWLIWLPLILGRGGLNVFPLDPSFLLFTMVGTLIGPACASLAISLHIGGWTAVSRLLRRTLIIRVGIQWYLLTFYSVVLIQVSLTCVLIKTNPLIWLFNHPSELLLLIPGTLVTIIYAPLGEEIGWRGFALPRLQHRYGPVVGTLILGLLWGGWHTPLLLFVPAFLGKSFIGSILYLASLIGFSYFMTWIFNKTRGSLLLSMLLHSSVNLAGSILSDIPRYNELSSLQVNTTFSIGLIGLGLLALLVTRGRLGYSSDTQPQL